MATDKEVTEIAERFCGLVRQRSIDRPDLAHLAPEDWQVHSGLAAINAAKPLPVDDLMKLDDATFAIVLCDIASVAEAAGVLGDSGVLQ